MVLCVGKFDLSAFRQNNLHTTEEKTRWRILLGKAGGPAPGRQAWVQVPASQCPSFSLRQMCPAPHPTQSQSLL